MPQKKSDWDRLKAQSDQTFVKKAKTNSDSNKKATAGLDLPNKQEADYTAPEDFRTFYRTAEYKDAMKTGPSRPIKDQDQEYAHLKADSIARSKKKKSK